MPIDTVPEYGIPPLPPEQPVPHSKPRPAMNRVLLATSGPYEGNTRAALALMAMAFLHGLFGLLLVAYFRGNAADLKDFILTMGAAIVTLDVGAVSWYYGKRSGEGA